MNDTQAQEFLRAYIRWALSCFKGLTALPWAAAGGIYKPPALLVCERHNSPREYTGCIYCNTEAIDAFDKRPGTITIRVKQ